MKNAHCWRVKCNISKYYRRANAVYSKIWYFLLTEKITNLTNTANQSNYFMNFWLQYPLRTKQTLYFIKILAESLYLIHLINIIMMPFLNAILCKKKLQLQCLLSHKIPITVYFPPLDLSMRYIYIYAFIYLHPAMLDACGCVYVWVSLCNHLHIHQIFLKNTHKRERVKVETIKLETNLQLPVKILRLTAIKVCNKTM